MVAHESAIPAADQRSSTMRPVRSMSTMAGTVERKLARPDSAAKKKPGMIAEKQEEAAAQEARDNSGAIVYVDETKPLVL